MLVTFSSPAYANITMFGDVAKRLIRLMGRPVTVPGALLAEDIPSALEKLQQSLAHVQEPPSQPAPDSDEDPGVSLKQRALPLIKLLEASAQADCEVVWRQGT